MMYVVAALGISLAAAAPGELTCWPVDPLVKVFRDAEPQDNTEAFAEVARGEHASFQVVVKCGTATHGLRATVVPLVLEGTGKSLTPRAPRFVGYVPVDRPTQTPSKDQLRKPPADYPDPLLEVESIDVEGGQAQPVWVTVPIPVDAASGVYTGQLDLTATVDGKEARASVPLTVRVYEAVVGPSRLWVTDWFAPHALHMDIAPEPESEEFYALLARYARNMAEHRHNVAIISAIGLAEFSVGSDGKLAVDFARFDRWVNVFKDAGVIGRIEGGHIGGRKGGWDSDFVVQIRQVIGGEVVASNADPTTVHADAFYCWFFPTLVGHLKEKGWIDIYMQHLADEPIAGNKDGYRAMAQLARKYGPELRIIEACHTKELAGAMDIWVPQLNYLHDDYDYYRQRQAEGEEVWFYTCVFPQGEYANRFIEQPLIKTRLLHWINFRYGATGYLHWGYNQWTKDSPFTHTTRPHGGPPYLPAGDPWIVYPGKDGPLDSIRFEAMRDGIADYEVLCQLNERDPEAAARLAKKHIFDFDKYATDVEVFRATRRELLKLLSNETAQ
jgi:Glycoside hydrolase 123, catalytic domain/Glycoside hydrolase 123 N-terminal domain